MDYEKLLTVRSSIRRFTKDPVSEEDIEKLLDAAQYSPAGHADFKGLAIAVIQDPKILNALAEENQEVTHRGNPIYGAPLLFLLMAVPGAGSDVHFNGAIVAENIHLEACNLGLGSVIVYSFIRELKKQPGMGKYFSMLSLPKGYEPVMSVAVGHTPVVPRERRKIAHFAVMRYPESKEDQNQ